MTQQLHLGRVLTFRGSPFENGLAAASLIDKGAILVSGQMISETGEAEDLMTRFPDARVEDHGSLVLMAGFVDCHVHYAQTGMIASWGKRLIDWLNSYTFPEEARFSDPAYADAIARTYLDLAISHGTTSFCTYGTVHKESVDAIFQAAEDPEYAHMGGQNGDGPQCPP